MLCCGSPQNKSNKEIPASVFTVQTQGLFTIYIHRVLMVPWISRSVVSRGCSVGLSCTGTGNSSKNSDWKYPLVNSSSWQTPKTLWQPQRRFFSTIRCRDYSPLTTVLVALRYTSRHFTGYFLHCAGPLPGELWMKPTLWVLTVRKR